LYKKNGYIYSFYPEYRSEKGNSKDSQLFGLYLFC